MVTIILIIN